MRPARRGPLSSYSRLLPSVVLQHQSGNPSPPRVKPVRAGCAGTARLPTLLRNVRSEVHGNSSPSDLFAVPAPPAAGPGPRLQHDLSRQSRDRFQQRPAFQHLQPLAGGNVSRSEVPDFLRNPSLQTAMKAGTTARQRHNGGQTEGEGMPRRRGAGLPDWPALYSECVGGKAVEQAEAMGAATTRFSTRLGQQARGGLAGADVPQAKHLRGLGEVWTEKADRRTGPWDHQVRPRIPKLLAARTGGCPGGVESGGPWGFEPSTSFRTWRCAANCATCPLATLTLAPRPVLGDARLNSLIAGRALGPRGGQVTFWVLSQPKTPDWEVSAFNCSNGGGGAAMATGSAIAGHRSGRSRRPSSTERGRARWPEPPGGRRGPDSHGPPRSP